MLCFEENVSETLICYKLPEERSNDKKRITLLTVIYWLLQLGCLQYWNGTFISISLSTLSLHYNLWYRHMPFSDVWDHMSLILGECRQSSVVQTVSKLIVQPWHIQCVFFSLHASGLWNSVKHTMSSAVLQMPVLSVE